MSKNRIARDLVAFLPSATNFCDLFAGGGAITHAALESGKYRRVICNDIDAKSVGFFADAISGKFSSERRVVDRATFHRLKAVDPYVRYIWSFGAKGDSYLWSAAVERVKLATCQWILDPTAESRRAFVHEFRVATGEELAESELDYIEAPSEWNQRRLRYLEKIRRRYPRKYSDLESLERLSALTRLQRLGRLHSLERLEPLERLAGISPVRTSADLVISTRDYRDVEIPPDSVIYCDIPYEGSSVNDDMHMSDFDFAAFYTWTHGQKNLFISSYDLPREQFELVWEKERRSIMSSTDNTTAVVERLFKPRDVAS